jgi:lipopolysaccharide transport system permease protein
MTLEALMIAYIKELTRYKELLYIIIWRDIIIKYKQSVMGFMWAIFMPILIIMSGILVKYAMATVSGKQLILADIVTVSVKALPWSFFVGSVRFSTNSLMGNSNLVSKIYFPKEIFPIAAVLSNLFDFAIAGSVLGVILIFAQVGWSINILWLPLIIVLLTILSVGIGLLLSALNLFFRDIKYIVEVLLTFGIFFTPVFYETEMFGKWSNIMLLNPLAPLLESINACVVHQQAPDFRWLTYSAVISLFLFCVSYPIFKRLESTFAENI